jgi:hypothetical protein
VNQAGDPSGLPLAIYLHNSEAAIVEENVIQLDQTTPIQFSACGTAKFFNNQTPGGQLIQGYDVDQQRLVNELETDVDLGAVLAT